MGSQSSQNLTSEQIMELLQSILKDIPTREDLKKFATSEEISQLRQTILDFQNENSETPPPISEFEQKLLGNEKALQRIREQIGVNQKAIDQLYQDWADNKRVLTEFQSLLKQLTHEINSLTNQISEISAGISTIKRDFSGQQQLLDEIIHNVEANTRVIGKLATVATDLNQRLELIVTKEEFGILRNEMIQRLDGLIKRIEIFDHEQTSMKVAMKRMEKIQKEETLRNDQQDTQLKKQQEKISVLEQKMKKASG